MCHAILLLPLLGLPVLWLLPLELALPAYLVLVAVSGWAYYYAIVAMRLKVVVGPEALLHSRGKVVTRDGLQPSVRIQGELWRVGAGEDLQPGDAVEVVGVDGLVLKVKRAGPTRNGTSLQN